MASKTKLLARLAKAEQDLADTIEKLGLISMNEAAELRGTSKPALIQLANRGRLSVVRVGEETGIFGKMSHTYVFRDEIEAFEPLK